MEEKVKHRIVGAFVLIALFAIFIPIAFKGHGSNNRGAHKRVFHVPAAPPKPQLSLPKFAPLPVARVNLDAQTTKPVSVVSHAKPVAAKSHPVAPIPKKAQRVVTKRVSKATKIIRKTKYMLNTPKAWVVQLASFADVTNAKKLEKRLQKKGYAAYTATRKNSKGKKVSRVLIGPEIKHQTAQRLQNKLAQLTHIKGIIIQFDPRVKRNER